MEEQKKLAKLTDAAEALEWNVDLCFCKNADGSSQRWAEFEKYSPAGEDFVFTGHYDDAADFVRQVRETYDNFDPDLHVEDLIIAKRNGFRDVPSVDVLVIDSEKIDAMLLELADALEEAFSEIETEDEEI